MFAEGTKKDADQTKVEEHDHLGVFFLVNKGNIDQEAFEEDRCKQVFPSNDSNKISQAS